MEELIAARMQMAFSLGFHIIFACIGMVMPFLMVAAQWRYMRTGREIYQKIAQSWAKGVAIFFATGAVSGTMLSFELGLLWPTFMEYAGPIIGMPFSLEGTAFFIEAIALGFFLYGRKKLNKWLHLASGLVVGIAGLASGILVVAANAWMNSEQAGFSYDAATGTFSNIDPIAAMLNEAWFSQALHMSIAAFVATGFAVAGVHAFQYLRHKSDYHRIAMRIALAFGAIAALLQPISGDISAKDIAERQPEKLAAMEAHFHSSKDAALIIGGIPDPETQTVKYGIHIPYALSFLAHGNLHEEVKGLDAFPEAHHPPVVITHIAFQVMVGFGMILMLIGITYLYGLWRKPHWLEKTWFLKALAFATPLGFLAVEAGWIVTEVGRQPWIMYKVMKTSEALTPMPGIQYSFYLTMLLYGVLAFVVYALMSRQIRVINKEKK